MSATESKRTGKLEKGKGENRMWCGQGRQRSKVKQLGVTTCGAREKGSHQRKNEAEMRVASRDQDT